MCMGFASSLFRSTSTRCCKRVELTSGSNVISTVSFDLLNSSIIELARLVKPPASKSIIELAAPGF
jgi:hypothetical protein